MFQVVDGDTVINAIYGTRCFDQSLEQGKRKIFFTHPSIDQGEVAIHNYAVDGIFRFRFQFDGLAAFPDRVPFAPHERVQPTQIRMPDSAERRLFDGVFQNRCCLLEMFLRFLKQKSSRRQETMTLLLPWKKYGLS